MADVPDPEPTGRAGVTARPAGARPPGERVHVVRRGERVRIDYSHELRISRNPILRVTYLTLGCACVVSGAIGVVLPGWPTTVFILLAAYFFARSSPRFYNALMNHRIFGPLVRDWRDGKGLSARAKTLAVTTIVLTIGVSIALLPTLWVRLLLAMIAIVLCTYLLTLPTKRAAA